MTRQELNDCKALAKKIRLHCLQMVWNGQSGHIGSMLSTADIYPVFYKKNLKVDPANPKMPDRDRFLLCKGHGGAALLACLAEQGFFPMDWLNRYYCDDGTELKATLLDYTHDLAFCGEGDLADFVPVLKNGTLALPKPDDNPAAFFVEV